MHVEGLTGSGSHTNGAGDGATNAKTGAGENLAEHVVQSALRYRAQAPLIDSLLGELGMKGGGDLRTLTESLIDDHDVVGPLPGGNGSGGDTVP